MPAATPDPSKSFPSFVFVCGASDVPLFHGTRRARPRYRGIAALSAP
jgi:hypothetical protein